MQIIRLYNIVAEDRSFSSDLSTELRNPLGASIMYFRHDTFKLFRYLHDSTADQVVESASWPR